MRPPASESNPYHAIRSSEGTGQAPGSGPSLVERTLAIVALGCGAMLFIAPVIYAFAISSMIDPDTPEAQRWQRIFARMFGSGIGQALFLLGCIVASAICLCWLMVIMAGMMRKRRPR